MTLSPDQALVAHAAGGILLALAAAVVIGLWLRHEHHNALRRAAGQPAKGHLQHVRTHAGHYASVGLVVGVGALLLLGVGSYVLLHHGGAKKLDLHIPPPVHRTAGAGTGAYTSVDLATSVRPIDQVDQQQTNSCCGWTVVRLDLLNRYLRDGEVVDRDAPMSGYKPWWYVTGGRNIGTDPVDEGAAYAAHGAEGLAYWGPTGSPDGSDAAHTLPIASARVTWNWYVLSGAGRAGLNDLEWHLDRGQPQGVIWQVHQGGLGAQTSDYTWDGGWYVFDHCLVAVQYTRTYPGLGEAVRLWNTWGTSYGRGGYIWVPAAVFESHFIGSFSEAPGPALAAWLPPPPPTPQPTATSRPRPTSTPRPRATPTPRPRPMATPHPQPTPAAAPGAYRGVYVLTRATNQRALPASAARIVRGLPRGTRLRSLGAVTLHWAQVQEQTRTGWARGWVWRAFVRRASP